MPDANLADAFAATAGPVSDEPLLAQAQAAVSAATRAVGLLSNANSSASAGESNDGPITEGLATTADLIAKDLGTRVFLVSGTPFVGRMQFDVIETIKSLATPKRRATWKALLTIDPDSQETTATHCYTDEWLQKLDDEWAKISHSVKTQMLVPILLTRTPSTLIGGEPIMENFMAKMKEGIEKRFADAHRRWLAGEGAGADDAEGFEDFSARVNDFLADVLRLHPGESVLVISHGGSIRVIHALAAGVDYVRDHRLIPGVPNCAVARYGVRDGKLTPLD